MNTTAENNAMIDTFIGDKGEWISHKDQWGGEYWGEYKPNKYHSNWNELMRAVDFIESIEGGIYQVNILQEGCFIQRRCVETIVDKRITKMPDGTTKRESVYRAVLEFIEKYNSN